MSSEITLSPVRKLAVVSCAQLPSGSSTDLADILASVKSIVHHVNTVTAGPELGHAIKELDRTLTNLDHVTAEVQPQIKPLIDSLRETSEAASAQCRPRPTCLAPGHPAAPICRD